MAGKGTPEDPITPDKSDEGATIPSANQEQTAPSESKESIDRQLLGELAVLRQGTRDTLSKIAAMLPHVPSPTIAEVIIAKRDIESAQMRLGVAMATVTGIDPWNQPDPQPQQ